MPEGHKLAGIQGNRCPAVRFRGELNYRRANLGSIGWQTNPAQPFPRVLDFEAEAAVGFHIEFEADAGREISPDRITIVPQLPIPHGRVISLKPDTAETLLEPRKHLSKYGIRTMRLDIGTYFYAADALIPEGGAAGRPHTISNSVGELIQLRSDCDRFLVEPRPNRSGIIESILVDPVIPRARPLLPEIAGLL